MFPFKYEQGAWVLDTGATNHIIGCDSLASLDESVRGEVRFGDGSAVEICRIGAVTILGRNVEHRVLTEVYCIPSLRCNIVSIGQLEEVGCRVEIDKGVIEVFDREQAGVRRTMLIWAERKNRLYVMKVKLTSPVCLLTKMDGVAWRWHACFRHLNFRSLRELGVKGMVEGIPIIKKSEQVCNGSCWVNNIRHRFHRSRPTVHQQDLSWFTLICVGRLHRPHQEGSHISSLLSMTTAIICGLNFWQQRTKL